MSNCPACHSSIHDPLYLDVPDFEHGFPISVNFQRCHSCYSIFQNPALTAAQLSNTYPTDYRPHLSISHGSIISRSIGNLKRLQASFLARKLLKYLPNDKNTPILEIGCGRGYFIEALLNRGYKDLSAIDQNSNLGNELSSRGVYFYSLNLDEDSAFPKNYGTIFAFNIVEHLVDPLRVLKDCRSALRTESGRGRLILLTPNSCSLSRKLFGQYWAGLHAPRHPQVFSKNGLTSLALEAGFERVENYLYLDPASWAISFQNFITSLSGRNESKRHASGTAWYTLLGLPFWYPFAAAELLVGRTSSFVTILQ